MNQRLARIHTGWWVALVAMLILLSFSVSLRIFRRQGALLKRTTSSLRELESLVNDAASRRDQLEVLIRGESPDPAAHIPPLAVGARWTFSPAESTALPHGFRHRVVNAEFEALRREDLGPVMQWAELQDPPWRVTELSAESTVEGLKGRLRLEALDKPLPSP